MSFKAKDLAYEAKQPAFLQRLKAGIAGVDADRHERPLARPRRLKNDAEDDDGPTYVLAESGESMSKAEYESFRAKEEREAVDESNGTAQEGAVDSQDPGDTSRTSASKEQMVEIGQIQRKRKAGKLIQDDVAGDGASSQPPTKDDARKPRKKTTKKATAVKLSFEDD